MSARASLWGRHLVPLPARSWLLDFGAFVHTFFLRLPDTMKACDLLLTDIFIFELLDRICAASVCVCVCLRRDANLALKVLDVG